MDSASYGGGTADEDQAYKNDALQGIEKVYGPQPREAMPHLTTKNFSPLDLNEWFLISLQNPDSSIDEIGDPDKNLGLSQWSKDIRSNATGNISPNAAYQTSPYIGPLYRGGQNEFRYNNRLNQPSNAGWSGDTAQGQDDAPPSPDSNGSSLRTCKSMIQPGMSVDNPAYSPEWMRLEMDNCANQYILRQMTRYSNMGAEDQSSVNGLSSDSCQPLNAIPVDQGDQEYAADWYYAIAWNKLLSNSNFLARNGMAEKEPNYGQGSGPNPHNIKISSPIGVPGKFGHTELSDLVTEKLKFERILDPSHPFSPRWDYEYTERKRYSPFTVSYGGNPQNAVRCAGGDIKVDVMQFRAERFRNYILSRIAWNIACYNNYYCKTYIWDPLGCTSDEPCCSTRFDQDDKFPTAVCDAGAMANNHQLTAKQLCAWLAKPIVPVNVLKMRENNKDNFPNGVPKGMTFKEYFTDHRPYMRCWDTGQECGQKGGDDYESYAGSDAGSKWAIMGAGREGQNCAIGGSEGRLGIPEPSPITEWTELKMYQMGAIRSGLYCLPRNDIFYKTKGSEDYALYSTGASPQLKFEDANGKMNRFRTTPWPKAWRGYVLEEKGAQRFPNLGGTGSVTTGLSGAKPGNLVIFDADVVMAGSMRKDGETGNDDTWRMPYVGIVEGGTNSANGEASGDMSESVSIIAHNHGKYPDACGNSQTDMGMGEVFTAYKDKLPDNIKKAFEKVGTHTETCADPSLSKCIEPLWDKVKVYDIFGDVR